MKIRTYLEMTDASELRPGRVVPEVLLEPTTDRALIRDLEARIGAPHGWRAATRAEQEWAEEFAKPNLRWWAVTHRGEPVGIVTLADRSPEVEILTFGLVPEAVGRGLGGHALTLGVRQAWSLAEGTQRVWLHTSTQDHPNALPNYRARGFRPYRTEVSGT